MVFQVAMFTFPVCKQLGFSTFQKPVLAKFAQLAKLVLLVQLAQLA